MIFAKRFSARWFLYQVIQISLKHGSDINPNGQSCTSVVVLLGLNVGSG